MSEATCSIDDCAKAVRSLGLCYSHYMKQWRYGDATFEQTFEHQDVTARRFGMLTVVRRQDRKWLCRCDCGEETVVRIGDLNRGSAQSCGNRSHRWRDDVGYSAAHGRVRYKNGSAKKYPCVDCGQQAKHWSYDHRDIIEHCAGCHIQPRPRPLRRPMHPMPQDVRPPISR